MSTHSAECCPHNCLEIETSKRAPSMNAMYGRTMIRKTSLLRKINPIARRSSFARKIIYNSLLTHLAMIVASAEMTWRLRMRFRKLLLQIPNSDQSPLYDVRDITHAAVHPDSACEVMFRGRLLARQAVRRSSISSGGARRDRTDDLMLAKHALSQLSYGPVPEDECSADRALLAELSAQEALTRWWAWEDLNFRPHAYQARALTN